MNINTTIEFIAAAAAALRERDVDAAFDLTNVLDNWILPADEDQAMRELLESVLEALGAL